MCNQPRHDPECICVNPIPSHKMHICICGCIWNNWGLTYAEYRERKNQSKEDAIKNDYRS